MTNFEQFLNNTLNEMGGAAMQSDRINKEHIHSTLKKYVEQVLTYIPHRGYQILGSAGKKPTSGDIDLGFDTDLTIDEVADKLDDLGVMYKVGKGFDQIWTGFPQYDENGEEVKDEDGRVKRAQIDLMFGDPDWLDFAYYSPGAEETEFSAHHAKVLLAATIRYAEEKALDDGSIQTHVINWSTGLWTKKRSKYISQRGKFKGQERERQIKSDKPVVTTPQGVADFLTMATGQKWSVSDMKQPFEFIWEKVVKSFDKQTLLRIAAYVRDALAPRPGYDLPDIVAKLFNESLTLNSSLMRRLSEEL